MHNPNTDEVHSKAKGGGVASRAIGGQQNSCFCGHMYFAVMLSFLAPISLLVYLSQIFKVTLYELPGKGPSIRWLFLLWPGLWGLHCFWVRQSFSAMNSKLAYNNYAKLRSVETVIERFRSQC